MLLFNYYYVKPTSFPILNVTSIYYILFVFIASILLFFVSKPLIKKIIIFCFNIFYIWTFSNDYYFLIVAFLFCIYGFIVSYLIHKNRNKTHYIAYIAILVVGLFLFKENYLGHSLIVPLGISFYTLRLIWYLNYIYNEKIEFQKDFISICNYLLFFPTFLAGPIENPISFFVEENKEKRIEYQNVKKGWVRLLYGIFEKIVICDYFALIVDKILLNNEVVGMTAFFGIILYSFQIYLDFDSYSNIALGSASIIGIELGENFKTPYLSKNIKEFWSKWHISLSSWLKENVYLPLGGNRKGTNRKIINIIIVFVVSALWHGIGVNFVLWGLAHSIIRIVEDTIEEKVHFNNNLLMNVVRIIVNFVIVSFTWVLFKYNSLSEICEIFTRISLVSQIKVSDLLTHHELIWMNILILFVILFDLIRSKINIYQWISKNNVVIRLSIYLVFIVVFLIFGVYGGSFEPSDFIYRWF